MKPAEWDRDRVWSVAFRGVLGIGLLVIAWGVYSSQTSYARRAVTTDATVASLTEAAVRDEAAPGTPVKIAVVRFQANGRAWQVRIPAKELGDPQQGRAVKIAYDPRNPEHVSSTRLGTSPSALVYVVASIGVLILIPWRRLRGRR